MRTGRSGNLEATLRGCDELGIDIVFLTETHLNDDKYTRFSHGYEVFASKATSDRVGGVAFAIRRKRGVTWEAEDLKICSANVMACTLVSGAERIRLIGVYIPHLEMSNTAEPKTLDCFSQEVLASTIPVIALGDFNANLEESAVAQQRGFITGDTNKEPRAAEVVAAMASLGLHDSGSGFRQRAKGGNWTYRQYRELDGRMTRIHSTVDYILFQGRQMIDRHRIRHVSFASSDHRCVYVDFKVGNQRALRQYTHKLSTFRCRYHQARR